MTPAPMTRLGLRESLMPRYMALQLGAWGATQTGIRQALACGGRLVVTLDADGQHKPALIRALLAPIRAKQADVVIGACPRRVSGLRRLAWHYFRTLTGLHIADLTSGFRAYNPTGDIFLFTTHVMITGLVIPAGLAATREFTEPHGRFAVQAQALDIARVNALAVLFFMFSKIASVSMSFFCGLAFTTLRQ